jgi:hypothetical protein
LCVGNELFCGISASSGTGGDHGQKASLAREDMKDAVGRKCAD